MSIDIGELQVEIGGVVFGAGTDAILRTIDGLGNGTLRERSYDAPREDGQMFGREQRNGRPLQFVGQVVSPGAPDRAWDRAADLEAMFDGADVRLTPRAVTACRFRRPGAATRVTFGRPDGYEVDPAQQAIGLLGWTGSFRRADPLWYGDVEKTTRVKLVSQSSGYVILNEDGTLSDPVVTTPASARASFVENAGNAPTWGVLRIGGPILNPRVKLVDADGTTVWALGINAEIPAGAVAVIDTRPWSRGAALESGAPLPGPLTTASIPSQSAVPRGVHDLVCGGIDSSGTSFFEFAYRDAYRNL